MSTSFITIDAVRLNPASVLLRQLPDRPSELLLKLSYRAAVYLRDSERFLAHAARTGEFIPAWWHAEGICPDAHEESEARRDRADRKIDEIVELLRVLYDITGLDTF